MGKETQDRRIQRTRKVLQDALIALIIEKGFDKVTIQDVTRRANIGRSTFYLHFKDIEDLFLSGFENLWVLFEEHFSNQTMGSISVWDLSLIVFKHTQSYIQVYKAMIGKQGGKIMSSQMHKVLSVLIYENIKGKRINDQQVPIELVVFHLTSSLTSLITWWIDHELPHSPKRMNEIFQQLTQPTIQNILPGY
jgi:hypothetical protein